MTFLTFDRSMKKASGVLAVYFYPLHSMLVINRFETLSNPHQPNTGEYVGDGPTQGQSLNAFLSGTHMTTSLFAVTHMLKRGLNATRLHAVFVGSSCSGNNTG